jgi:hypothetical protein
MPTLSSRIVQSCLATYAPAPITRFGRRRITRFGTNLQRRGARHSTRPARLCRITDALGAVANTGTKGTIGMNTRPNIIAQDLSAVPAVRGNER